MDLANLTEAVTDRVGDRVDTATQSVSRQVDAVGDRTADRIDDLVDLAEAQLARAAAAVDDARDRAADAIAASSRTGWGTRVAWLGLGAALGAVAAWLLDPQRGRHRRHEVAQRATSTGRQLGRDVAGVTEQATSQARGAVHEAADAVTPDDVPDDPELLRQRIRSEVLGHRDDADAVVVRVDGPGQVTLKGTVPDEQAVASLTNEVRAVDGVTQVEVELAVSG